MYAFDGKDLNISETILIDTWNFENLEDETEAWWLGNSAVSGDIKDNILKKSTCYNITKHRTAYGYT